MWKLKKMIANIIAFASIVGCVTTTTLGVNAATTYQKGDVNGDGSVNNTDTQWARQFLYGMAGTSDGATAERLDVNQNGIIDENDVNTIRNIILHVENGGVLTSKNIDILPVHSSKTYQEFNAQTGNKIGSTYTVSDVGNISTVSSRMVIGDDTRVKDYSKSGVVKLNMKAYLNGKTRSYVGTGFVVDDHTILTAAHCVYFTGDMNFQETDGSIIEYYENHPNYDIQYTLYNSNGTVKETHTAKSYHVPTEYINVHSYQENGRLYDYALITVEEDLSAYNNFDLGVARNYITAINPMLYVNGYSGDPNEKLFGEIVSGSGNLNSVNINEYNIFYNVDTVGGTSGGPLYVKNSNGSMTVIGINSGENAGFVRNHAKRIDTNVLNFIYNNSRIG